jgi:hypothetical protein
MNRIRCFLFVLLCSASSALPAQDIDSLLLGDELDFLIAGDSLSLLSLIDSLLSSDSGPSSQVQVRVGYNSNVLSAGRTLGIENFGLSPGWTYYHKSGLFADVSGFWSRDFEPRYYLTIASLGYSHVFSKYFSLMANYDRYFYNFDDAGFVPYKNTFSVSPSVDVKRYSLTVNYSLYTGDKNVHRIAPTLSGRFEVKNFMGLKRIALLPMVMMLVGDETFYFSETWIPENRLQALRYFRDYGTIYLCYREERIRDHELFVQFTTQRELPTIEHDGHLFI